MNEALKEKIETYYTHYYRDACSLRDWEKRAKARVQEESDEQKKMGELQNVLGISFKNQRHCVVGAGTGGLLTLLAREYGVDVYGVEPCDEEFEIILERFRETGIPENHIQKVGGEDMPFEDNMFDVVHCYTVLEHVNDVEKCIDEMIRVVKPGGRVYINTPNYSFPYERHYKIPFPTFLPRFIGKLYLRLLGKSPSFLDTVNYITEKSINKILIRKKGIIWFRLYRSQTKSKGLIAAFFDFLKFSHFVYPNQEIIIVRRDG